jgi:hypothetical protein
LAVLDGGFFAEKVHQSGTNGALVQEKRIGICLFSAEQPQMLLPLGACEEEAQQLCFAEHGDPSAAFGQKIADPVSGREKGAALKQLPRAAEAENAAGKLLVFGADINQPVQQKQDGIFLQILAVDDLVFAKFNDAGRKMPAQKTHLFDGKKSGHIFPPFHQNDVDFEWVRAIIKLRGMFGGCLSGKHWKIYLFCVLTGVMTDR